MKPFHISDTLAVTILCERNEAEELRLLLNKFQKQHGNTPLIEFLSGALSYRTHLFVRRSDYDDVAKPLQKACSGNKLATDVFGTLRMVLMTLRRYYLQIGLSEEVLESGRGYFVSPSSKPLRIQAGELSSVRLLRSANLNKLSKADPAQVEYLNIDGLYSTGPISTFVESRLLAQQLVIQSLASSAADILKYSKVTIEQMKRTRQCYQVALEKEKRLASADLS